MKPPQKPTMRNRLISLERLVCLLLNDHSRPMRKQPSMFTVNVPSGKVDMFFNARETMYRNMPPKQLPAPTISISFIIKTIFNSSHPPLHKREREGYFFKNSSARLSPNSFAFSRLARDSALSPFSRWASPRMSHASA